MSMPALFFAIVAAMLAVYVVLDGYDLGAGFLARFVARNDRERGQVIRTIAPFWDGNEVWLLAAGGVLFAAFPVLYARAFSGFYLPLMIVLWLLALRGISIEFRNKIANAVWRPFWDTVFVFASGLLAFVLGVALGNVMRGVPIGEDGRFFAPLFEDPFVHDSGGVLDVYTATVGLLSLAALSWHGALWLAMKADGPVGERARRISGPLALAVALLTIIVTAATFSVQPLVSENFSARPWGAIFPFAAVGGLLFGALSARRRRDLAAFIGSSAYLAALLASAAQSLYPVVLPSSPEPSRSLTAHDAAASEYGLSVALAWWVPGMALAAVYFVIVYRRFRGKVAAEGDGGAY